MFRISQIKSVIIKSRFMQGLTLLLSASVLTGCATEKLNYTVDPEISSFSQISNQVEMISVSVKDNRANSPQGINPELTLINPPENLAELLKTKLLNQVKSHQLKIINNPLLADLSITLEVNEMYVTLNTSLIKSEIKAVSEIKLIAKTNVDRFEKVYRHSRKQEVANPVQSIDLSGVMNQVLSNQLSEIFADQQFRSLKFD